MRKKKAALHTLCAHDRNKIFRRSLRLLPALAKGGAAPADALAVAYNAVFLFYSLPRPLSLFSPKQILKRYSLMEIALLCESFLRPEGVESGVNLQFEAQTGKGGLD